MEKFQALSSSAFGSICRTCLIYGQLFLINEICWEGIELKEIISIWTSLEVKENDQLPQQMCNDCIRKMYQTHYFLSKCKQAERNLKNILLNAHSQSHSEANNSDIVLDLNHEKSALAQKVSNSESSEAEFTNTDNVSHYKTKEDTEVDAAEFEYIKVKTEFHDLQGLIDDDDDDDDDVISNSSIEDICDEPDLLEIQSIKTEINEEIAKINKHKHLQQMRKKGFKCATCEKFFPTRDQLREHKINTHKKHYKFQCSFCSDKYESLAQLRDHIRTHTGEKPFHCDICDESFSFKCVLKRHMVMHMKNKPYSCQYCFKEFTRKSRLDQHEREHTGEKLLCRFCGQEFNSPKTVSHHEENFHNEIPEVPTSVTADGWKCELCGQVLSTKKTLHDHVLLHGSRNIRCDLCGKTFTNERNLRSHKKLSHQNVTYPCTQCNKVFKQEVGLKKHTQSRHEGVEYVCEECWKVFKHLDSLRDHRRLHNNDTRYQCKICNRICMNNRQLKSHMETHLKNSDSDIVKSFSFSCNVCEQTFQDFPTLKRHIKEMHKQTVEFQ